MATITGNHSRFRALPSRTLTLQINNPFLLVLVTFCCSDQILTRVTCHGVILAPNLRMQSFTVGWEHEVAGHRVSSVRKEGVGAQLSFSFVFTGDPSLWDGTSQI